MNFDAKEEDEDEEEDDINDDKFENSGDPERLKAFNVRFLDYTLFIFFST